MAFRPFITSLLGLDGTPESGGLLRSVVKGTSTPLPLYSDSAGAVPLTNPVVATSLGTIVCYFNDTLEYSWQAKTADNATTLWEANVVSGVLSLTYVNPEYSEHPIIEASWVPALGTPLGTGWPAAFAQDIDEILDDAKGIRVCATYAEMTGLSADELSNWSAFRVQGRIARGDGGGGDFTYRTGDQSATVVKSITNVNTVDTTRDLLQSNAPTVLTNDVVLATVADAGLSTETLYFVRLCEETAALAQGTTPANVATGAFLYSIGGTIYSKDAVAAGTAPGNDVVPQGKWGCVAFEIGADGTIDVVEAPDNATGYAEKYLARNDLPSVQASHIRIGDVCVTKSDGAFTFGTTSLSAANVNAIYTNAVPRSFMSGWFSLHTSYEDATSGSNKVNITALSDTLPIQELLDPQQGVYVIPDGGSLDGSDGCFVRDLNGPLRPEWFNVSDAADALNAAATFGLNRSDHCHIEYDDVGEVSFDRQAVIWLPDVADGAEDSASEAQLRITGRGRGVTRLKWASGSAIRIIYGAQGNAVEVSGLSMVTGEEGGGKALILENQDPNGYFGEFTGRNIIDVDFHGSDGMVNVKYWATCIDCIDVSFIDFKGSTFNGTWAVNVASGKGVVTRAHYGNFATTFDLSGCAFRFLTVGYEYGHGSQSATLAHAFFAQNTTDVLATAGGTDHQGLTISDSEAFKGAAGHGVEIECRVPNFRFTDNEWAVHAGYSAVVMSVQDMTTILGNQFFPNADPNDAVSAIDINGTVSGALCIIDHNNFASVTIGARLLGDSSDVYFGQGNTCTAGMTLVSDAGSGNDVYPLGVLPTITSAVRSSSASAGVGYAAGAGGTVTQATSKSTGVTLNKVCGYVVMNNASLAAGATVSFTLTNSAILAFTDVLVVNVSDGTAGAYLVNAICGSGLATIQVTNISGGALAEALVLRFAVIRGVAA